MDSWTWRLELVFSDEEELFEDKQGKKETPDAPIEEEVPNTVRLDDYFEESASIISVKRLPSLCRK